MKKKIFGFLAIISLLSVLYSCKEDSATFLPNVSGAAGEVVVVIEKHKWESRVGDSLMNILNQEHIALPQPEPILDIYHIPSAAFTNIFA